MGKSSPPLKFFAIFPRKGVLFCFSFGRKQSLFKIGKAPLLTKKKRLKAAFLFGKAAFKRK